jgi:hypothetical protein
VRVAAPREGTRSRFADGWARYWYGWNLSPERQRLFRSTFFAVLAIDLVLFSVRAAYYGDFNVSAAGMLDRWIPVPAPWQMGALWLTQAGLALRLAVGVGGRGTLITLFSLWTVALFWSLIDGYQHHYLIWWVLLILTAWNPSGSGPSWPLRLLMAMMAIVYGWSVVAKLDGLWLDGTLPQVLTQGTRTPRVIGGLADALAVSEIIAWRVLAASAVVVELALAVLLLFRRGWPFAAALGVPFHATLWALGLPIGRFSAYLVTLYLIVIPDRWIPRWVGWRWPQAERPISPMFAVVAGVGIASIDLPGRWFAAAVVTIWALVATLRASRPERSRHVLAALTTAIVLPLAAHMGHVERNYFADLGHHRRATGNLSGAADAYREVVRRDGGYVPGWVTLGDANSELDRPVEAAAAYTMAALLEPDDPSLARLRDHAVAAITSLPGSEAGTETPEEGKSGATVANAPKLLAVHEMALARSQLAAGAIETAVNHYVTACKKGNAQGCTGAAGYYAAGLGVAADPRRAAGLFHLGCYAGDPVGCANLGILQNEGRGTARDSESARELLDRACRAGVELGCRERRRLFPD